MQEYNVKADIWSLGCVVFEMLVGGPPFTGQNPRELFMNIRSRHIRIPNDVFISTELQQLLLRMLEIDPRKRIDLLSLLAEAERLQPSFKVEVNESSSFENQQPLDEIYESSEQKYSSETLVMSPTVADEQPLQRQPSGIAIGLSGSSGSMRRVRSRDQISGNISSSPPTVGTLAAAPVSTSPASQRPASVTSATATMIMALANTGGGTNSPSSGTSPSQGNMVPKHRRTSSGDRRYSAGDLSPVTKALSISKGDINDRPPTSTETSKVKDSSNFQLANSRGNTMVFGLSGPIDQGRGVAMARSQAKTYDNEGEDSDDFVMVKQTPGHPWKAFPNEPTQPQANASGIVNWSNNSDQYNMSGMIAQDESMNFQATANRCAYMVQMITAITEVADKMVRDSLHPRFWKSDKKRLTDVESKENKSNIPDDESVGSHSSGDRSNRPRSFDMSQLPELLAPPFALYLHAITFLHDTIQRTLKFKETASMDSTRNLLDALIEVRRLSLGSSLF